MLLRFKPPYLINSSEKECYKIPGDQSDETSCVLRKGAKLVETGRS